MCLYTAPLDIVVDPFAGGGCTIHMCRKRMRRYWASDRNPRPAWADQIRKMDAVKELPALYNRWSEVTLTYLDAPYWKQAEGKYSNDPEDLSNMSLEDFTDSLFGVTSRVSEKQTRGVIALRMGPTQYAAPDKEFTDHVFDIYKRVDRIKKLKLEIRVSCPFNSEIYELGHV